MMNKVSGEIRKALIDLGVKGHAEIKKCDSITVMVKVDGKSFGLWDISKKTFVA